MNIKLPRNTVIMLGNMVKNEITQVVPGPTAQKWETSELEVRKMKRGTQETDGGQGSRAHHEPGLSMMTQPTGAERIRPLKCSSV
jgi:hypothetical protein